MNPNPKLRPEHLERQAVVYIRQSSMRQPCAGSITVTCSWPK